MSKPDRRLVSVGNVIVDITARVVAMPERGSDVLASGSQLSTGGSFNTLVAARRLGLAAGYAGASGTGPFGDLVRTGMRDEGIEVLLPPTHGLDTGYAIALVEPDGERRFITAFGAEATLRSDQLDPLALQPGDLVHVSGYGLLEHTNAAVLPPWLLGLRAEHLVLLDPGPLVDTIASATLTAVLERADWLSCNERESSLMTGQGRASDAARTLAESGVGVVIRLGADGCLVYHDDRLVHLAGYATQVVDTTGAGDAHVGAFLAGIAADLSPVDAARRANAGAAIAVSRPGPATAPTTAEVDQLLSSSA